MRPKEGKLITELGPGECRFPVGPSDAANMEFQGFCGASTLAPRKPGERRPYCAHHHEQAHLPARKARP